MDKMLLNYAFEKGLNNELKKLMQILGVDVNNNYNYEELYSNINEFINKKLGIENSSNLFIIKLLEMCFDIGKVDLAAKSTTELTYMIYRLKDNVLKCYENNKKNIAYFDDDTVQEILRMSNDDFTQLIELFATLGLMVEKLYGDLEHIRKTENNINKFREKISINIHKHEMRDFNFKKPQKGYFFIIFIIVILVILILLLNWIKE